MDFFDRVGSWVQHRVLGFEDRDVQCAAVRSIEAQESTGLPIMPKDIYRRAKTCRYEREVLENPHPSFTQRIGIIWRGL